ncbi:unnamed protein product [Lathyrus oleraceus]
MDSGYQKYTVLREDVKLMKNQLNQLMEAMIGLENKDDNIQWTTITKNVIPPQVNDQAQPQHVQIPVKALSIQEHPIIRDGYSSPHDGITYHKFTFAEPNSQGEILVRKTKRTKVIEIIEKYRVREEILKDIEGHDAFDLDALNMCLVPSLVITPKFKVPPTFKSTKGIAAQSTIW